MKDHKNFLPKLFILFVALQFVVLTGHKFGAISTAHAQTTVISDTLFNPDDWSVVVESEFGASETNEQRLTGGNPGAYRFMQHILPIPSDPAGLSLIEVTPAFRRSGRLAGSSAPTCFCKSWQTRCGEVALLPD